ncbi:NADP-dependent malic enzyme [Kingella kingae]|uniref:NADP-dependent malic enzyme n=1 Tax=Kingella kingae TaxID=504 RepID=UPI0002584B4A|nr:NADP-dependent malic enzyme [Kingella kingae]EIC13681.1 bifunctional malic enzyme oxidoreductase/phosphotransacetylase [Kingella kingae PYKK081]MBD3614026.1 NADP-dependent malic enzyme [Kingella kingae]MBD3632393.1 NADP-dependent malic enzyme [Kingella kingae]MBD3659786.1 NADP-dependent malic enzyme [Kingella kingae]MDK4567960.1 NADP-dependent malic enzyme [Kingella kingae]
MDEHLKEAALHFHEFPMPGKIQVAPTKPLATQYDLSLAYSPGVAAPCMEIHADPLKSYKYTARGNLVAVISNGTAVLGLGNIGPEASKPVMEGKGVLFKKFADINVFDIEVNETDPDKLVDIIASLEPTFGGINLEDIKAPECFYIEKKLRERCKIPVFHDDQHGTAIITAAAVLNGLRFIGKDIADVKLVCSGAGAAAIACLDLLVALGMKRENMTVCDSKGVIYQTREDRDRMDESKVRYAIADNGQRVLGDAVAGKDIFLGLSSANVLKPEMLQQMNAQPLVFALANPQPEIWPPEAKAARPDVIIGTGRSDFPNQVNNVLCFPFIFRGALDVGATTINEEMKLATVRAIADLALAESNDVVAGAYGGEELKFGAEYLIPKPFDPRLIAKIAPAVAQAAMDSGVATRPITNMEAYVEKLNQQIYKTNLFMRPVFAQAKKDIKRIVLAEGEDERILHAAQQIVSQKLAYPVLIGRRDVIEQRLEAQGLTIQAGKDFDLIDLVDNPYYEECWKTYYDLQKRKGVTEEMARRRMMANQTLIGATMVRLGHADGMVAGAVGRFRDHFKVYEDVIGYNNPENNAFAMNALISNKGNFFIADTYVIHDPTAEQLAQGTLMCAREIKRFGIQPKVALVSNSNYGSHVDKDATKMQVTLQLIRELDPELEIDGEMQADVALDEKLRKQIFPETTLTGTANLLVMPNVEAANISYNLMRVNATNGITVGPILMGLNKPVHMVTSISTVRRIVNMVAIAAVDAQSK